MVGCGRGRGAALVTGAATPHGIVSPPPVKLVGWPIAMRVTEPPNEPVFTCGHDATRPPGGRSNGRTLRGRRRACNDGDCRVGTLTHVGRGRPGRGWRRIFHIHADRVAQTIPPLDALQDEIDKRVAAGESEEDVTLAVVEDFEKSAATVNARTTPLVPASGIVVTGAGILAKAGSEGEAATIFAFVAMAFALVGLGFLATALF